MKKIIYFVPTFPVISETFILREVSKLIELGNLSISIVSFSKGNAQIPEKIRQSIFYIKLSFLDILFGFIFLLKHLTRFFALLWMVLKFNDGHLIKNLYLLSKSPFYASKLESLNPEEIFCHFLSDVSTLMCFVAYLLGIPISISGHATDVFKGSSMLGYKVNFCKFITLCNSLAYQKVLESTGNKGRKNVYLMYHGIDTHLFRLKSRDMSSSQSLNIITDGRFVPKKGLAVFSKAMVELLKKGLELKITIIGVAGTIEQEKHLGEIIKIFNDSGYLSHLVIPGSGKGVTQEEVAKIYNEADIFIYAGIDTKDGDVDGVPNAILQAAFTGIPVISTLSGSIRDLLNSKNSYLIDQNDVNSIIMALLEMLEDSQRIEKVKELFKNATQEFNLELNVRKLEMELLK